MTTSDLEECFPSLVIAGYGVTSPQTPRYNCIAWAVGDTRRWWWPDPSPFAYWPANIPRENTLQRFIEAFQTLGYEPCENAGLEPDVEKVAVYADDAGAPTHAARQLSSGARTSKLGREEDIEHRDLAGVEGEEYGHVVQLLRRPLSGVWSGIPLTQPGVSRVLGMQMPGGS